MNTHAIGDNVFVLANDRTAVFECKVTAIIRGGEEYRVEPLLKIEGYSSIFNLQPSHLDVFAIEAKAKAWYIVAEKWAAIRDVAEANRARAVDQSIA